MRKLMWFTLGFGAACAWGAYFANRFALMIGVSALVLTGILAVISRYKMALRPAVFLLAGLTAGMFWFWAFDEIRLTDAKALDGQTRMGTICVSDYSRETTYGYAVNGTISLEDQEYDVCVYLNSREEPMSLVPGDKIDGEFLFRVTTGGNPGESAYYQGRGTFLLAYQRSNITVLSGKNRDDQGSSCGFTAGYRRDDRNSISGGYLCLCESTSPGRWN